MVSFQIQLVEVAAHLLVLKLTWRAIATVVHGVLFGILIKNKLRPIDFTALGHQDLALLRIFVDIDHADGFRALEVGHHRKVVLILHEKHFYVLSVDVPELVDFLPLVRTHLQKDPVFIFGVDDAQSPSRVLFAISLNAVDIAKSVEVLDRKNLRKFVHILPVEIKILEKWVKSVLLDEIPFEDQF